MKRILKLTVGFRKEGILTDPSIDLITRKSFANIPPAIEVSGFHGTQSTKTFWRRRHRILVCKRFKSNLLQVYDAENIQEDIINIELNELLSKLEQPEPLSSQMAEVPVPSAAPTDINRVTFKKDRVLKHNHHLLD